MKNICNTRFYGILAKISDLIIANLLFVAGSLPVITIGVSLRALYCAVTESDAEEKNINRIFWSAYRDRFRQMFACSAAFTAAVIILIADFVIVTQFWSGILAEVSSGLIIAAGTVLLFAGAYLFPILSLEKIKIRDAVTGSFALSMRYLPNSFLICVLNVLPAVLTYYRTYIMWVVLPFWICIGFSLTAYVNVRLMRPAFNDIVSKEKE